MSSPAFWPFSPAGAADPYPAWEAQRAADPLAAAPESGMWVATGHRHVSALLRDGRCGAARAPAAEQLGAGDAARGTPLRRTLERMATLSDPPRHARVRRPLQRAFAPAVVGPWRPRVRAIAEELLGAAERGRAMEVVGAFSDPLVGAVLEEQLRMPPGRGAELRAAWRVAAAAVDRPELGGQPDAGARLLEVHEAVALQLKRVRAQPGFAPIDVLVHTAAEDPELGEHDLISNVIFVLSSGHRSASQALALAVHSLACHPAELEWLRTHPDRLAGAVEELLRWDSSVLTTSRVVREDVELDGRRLAAGQLAVLLLGAANRDPEAFESAARLDLSARAPRHASFGRGAHLCVGAALARIVMQEGLAALLERASGLSLAEPPEWTTARRGFERLVVRW